MRKVRRTGPVWISARVRTRKATVESAALLLGSASIARGLEEQTQS
jgi:hypothetical protein